MPQNRDKNLLLQQAVADHHLFTRNARGHSILTTNTRDIGEDWRREEWLLVIRFWRHILYRGLTNAPRYDPTTKIEIPELHLLTWRCTIAFLELFIVKKDHHSKECTAQDSYHPHLLAS